jgi:hypothetical protein
MTHDQYIQLVAQVHGLHNAVLLLLLSLAALWVFVIIGKR